MVNREIKRIVFIGAGNMATRLAQALHSAGYEIAQVYSRTETSARNLAEKLGCDYTHDIEGVVPDADMYIFAVSDSALEGLIARTPARHDALWVHTAGSMSMEVFSGRCNRYGIFYPLQTLSKDREVSFDEIPVFIEADSADDTELLRTIGLKISHRVMVASSEQRKYLHLAAVFACNFTNHMYAIATGLLARQGLSFDALRPLIKETASKIETLSPLEAQTGPAVRYDENVMQKHIDLLDSPAEKELYRLISRHIHTFATKDKS
ncbi:MAG: DUF2520 domain-containing protein [Coprobacter sp.]|nr:DUF2520 domain-containing protein [Coprobacter sp.]